MGYEADYWSATFFVNNLFDRDYLTGRDINDSYYVGDPRVIGATFSARF